MNPSNPLTRSGTKLLAGWLAAAVVGTISAFAVGAPASAAPSGGTYQPACYTVGICLGRNPTPVWTYRLTASTLTYDVGPTPYYISIFDAYTGERLALCGRGTECTTDQGTPGRCYEFVAYVGGDGMSMPPEPVQRTSAPLYKCFGAG